MFSMPESVKIVFIDRVEYLSAFITVHCVVVSSLSMSGLKTLTRNDSIYSVRFPYGVRDPLPFLFPFGFTGRFVASVILDRSPDLFNFRFRCYRLVIRDAPPHDSVRK